MITLRSKQCLAAALLAVGLTLAFARPSPATSDSTAYDDTESEYLKVAYRFIYPVGKAAELLLFRPLHAVGALTQPDPDRAYYSDEDTLGYRASTCLGARPKRSCSR